MIKAIADNQYVGINFIKNIIIYIYINITFFNEYANTFIGSVTVPARPEQAVKQFTSTR